MANYAITTFTTKAASPATVAALIETQLETVVDTKTIRHLSYVPQSGGNVVGILQYDT